VTGWFGNSGRTIPVRTRNWPAVTISLDFDAPRQIVQLLAPGE